MSVLPTVLFVEDDSAFVQALSMEFRGDYNTIPVQDPEDGIDQVRERRGQIDVAVVDLWMPPRRQREVDQRAGLGVLRAVKGSDGRNGIDPDTEVIILSGHLTPDVIAEAEKHGAFACIVKGTPNWQSELAEKIKLAGIKSVSARIARLQERLDGFPKD